MASRRIRAMILDDNQHVAFKFANWSSIRDRLAIDSFPETSADEDVDLTSVV